MVNLLDKKYINDDINLGFIVDWKFIFKEFKKLVIKGDYYTPYHVPMDKASYFFCLSERSTGKTTTWLIVGLLLHKFYGVRTEYLVPEKKHSEPKAIRELFTTINNLGYVEKLTDGRWKSIYVYGGRVLYCNYDDDGKIIEKSDTPIMCVHSIMESHNFKSTYNSDAVLIILDEFMRNTYTPTTEYIDLLNWISTIKRKRLNTKIVLCSNLVDLSSTYFDNFNIRDEVETLQTGDKLIITTDKGTPLYLEMIDLKERKKSLFNKKEIEMYYGFNNPEIVQIIGGGWSEIACPLIIPMEGKKVHSKNHRIRFNKHYLALDIVYHEETGVFVECHECNGTIYDDTIVYVNESPTKIYERYGYGKTKLDNFIFSLLDENRWRYSTTRVGTMVKRFLESIN